VIALVDYGAGNLTSVRKALTAIGAEIWTPVGPSELTGATGIIVPGVGHFSSTARLEASWRSAIRAAVARSVPLLGICVGLQWLFDGSAEAADVPGLGAVRGVCARLGEGSRPGQDRLKVPHVGWNSLSFPRRTRLLEGVPEEAQVYFTHSYAAPVVPATAAVTTYGITFSAAVEHGLVSGVQFHPEKSGQIGLRILRNWLESVPAGAVSA
jgi:imidazole glycerol-phosphate synthase subunit HisH